MSTAKCFLYLIQIFEIRQLGFDSIDGEKRFFSATGGAMLKWWRPLNKAMWIIQQETETPTKKGIRATHNRSGQILVGMPTKDGLRLPK